MARFVFIVWVIAGGVVAAQNADVEVGRGVFRIYCSPCHGISARGGRGPDLTRGLLASGAHDDQIFRVIADGVNGTEMEAFGGTLSDDSIRRTIAFLRSLQAQGRAERIPGDAAAGELVFWNKGQCGACHRVRSKGGGAGPDLSRIGRQRSADYLRTSIVDPNADIAPGYGTVTVITRDGKRISGLERGFDNFTVQLTDLAGRFYSFERDKVASVTRERRSLMPSYRDRLSSAELQNIVAYLAGLSGVEVNR